MLATEDMEIEEAKGGASPCIAFETVCLHIYEHPGTGLAPEETSATHNHHAATA
jgi:hypothetical protein